MRIRKRQVPLNLSSLPPRGPLSPDPLFNQSPVVQLQQPSDHHPNQPIAGPTNGRDSSDATSAVPLPQENNKKEKIQLVLFKEEEEDDDEEKVKRDDDRNDTRKKSILGANIDSGFVFPKSSSSSSSLQAVRRWCEGDKAFPLKKRRSNIDQEMIVDEEDDNKKLKSKMKTKMNKKYCNVQQQQHQNDNYDNDNKQQKEKKETNKEGGGALDSANGASKKKQARGGALMEGSRCSRVNGRGWRCCQQTLVGYSLCEHHLGKGRLRSMNSVRGRSLSKKDRSYDQPLLSSSSSLQGKEPKIAAVVGDVNGENNVDEQEEDEKKPLMVPKKRVKLGMVKARSISSLLGQTDSAIAVVADDNNK